MSNIVAHDFLHSFCAWMVQTAAAFTPAVTIAYATTPRQLWRQMAQESGAADPYAVIRQYAGPPLLWHPLVRWNLQLQTTGTNDEAAAELAWQLYQTLLDAAGKPVRMAVVPGYYAIDNTSNGTYLIHHVDPHPPGSQGRDDRGRSIWVSNMEVGFCRQS